MSEALKPCPLPGDVLRTMTTALSLLEDARDAERRGHKLVIVNRDDEILTELSGFGGEAPEADAPDPLTFEVTMGRGIFAVLSDLASRSGQDLGVVVAKAVLLYRRAFEAGGAPSNPPAPGTSAPASP